MKNTNSKKNKMINNMEFNDKYDLQKAKNLFFLSDSELLEYTNHTEYDDDENHKYIKIIKKNYCIKAKSLKVYLYRRAKRLEKLTKKLIKI